MIPFDPTIDPQFDQQLDAALTGADGMPHKITRIVLEPLPGRFRLTLYSGDRALYSSAGQATGLEIKAATDAAAVLIECHSSLLPPRPFNPERN